MSGFQPRGNFARCGERLFFMFGLKPGADTGFQKGIPPSADGGQPARLDRAGPRARTRLSPAGGMGAVVWAKKISSPGSTPQVN